MRAARHNSGKASAGKQGSGTRESARDIPTFSLYGEAASATGAEFVHIEDIQSRSERHNWEIDAHTHRGLFQVVAVEAGGATVLLDGRRIEAAPPAVVAVPPAAVHAFRFRQGTRGYVLTVAEALLFDEAGAAVAGAIERLFVEPRVVAFDADTMSPLLALLQQVAEEFRQEAHGRAALVEWLVRAALLHVARAHLVAARSDQDPRGLGRAERFASFRKLVEDHYREHWPLARYAASLKITEGQLNRLARNVAGTSAAELVQQRLLLEARRRLIHVAAPVVQIAYELGYQDPAYFCRIFKKRVGLTPSVFRRQAESGQ
jgi:AraC family transcriptional activator of pobA